LFNENEDYITVPSNGDGNYEEMQRTDDGRFAEKNIL